MPLIEPEAPGHVPGVVVSGSAISVVGGGVAGLAAARALARAGHGVTLYERAAAFHEVGAGIQISPNGMRALGALGLGDAVREVSVASEGVRLIDSVGGRTIVELAPRGPALFVHRARLIEVLAAGAAEAGAALTLSSEIEPENAEGDLVVAADGVRSAFRRAIEGPDKPAFTGQVAWRAVIADPDAPPVAEVFLGPGRHLVTYPLAGGLRNIVAAEDRRVWVDEGWNHRDDPAALARAFRGFPARVRRWLDSVDEVHLWGLFCHPVARRWHDGRRVLVGDAAHPTLPYLAQGANLALEDAVILARAVAGPGLNRFRALRRPRVQRVVAAATANARNFHITNPVLRGAAFSALRLRDRLLPGAAGRGFAWVWDYDPATVRL